MERLITPSGTPVALTFPLIARLAGGGGDLAGSRESPGEEGLKGVHVRGHALDGDFGNVGPGTREAGTGEGAISSQ